MFHCRCVKTNGRYEIQYVMNRNKFHPIWQTYLVANSWDALVSKIMERKHIRFCSDISQKQFDNVTHSMLECSHKGYIGL